ncbi:MAG: efflux RND transporter periplasmic adaptor subunit [Pseudomonadota bacterium]|nr:efflux RND transporter periplasmic adaptor subunit [Pseudomonadota bacterium]
MKSKAHDMRGSLLLFSLLLSAALVMPGCGGDEPAAGADGGAGGPPGGKALSVEAVVVKPQPLSAGLQTVGSLRADESVVMRPEIAGRISRIHFSEGGRVEAGQPLFTLDASLARASLNEASANLENSRRAAQRTGQLIEEQLIARADHDTARAALGVDQARVASARTALSKMTLRAPFSGRIGLRDVSVGDYVSEGQDLVTVVRLDPVEVDFSLPERAMGLLGTGQKVSVTVDAFPGETFTGEVVAIDPVVDPNSRSVRLRAQIPNPDSRLRPGQFATVQVDTGGDRADALLIPEQALMQDGDVRFVYTVVDGKAHKAVIATGTRVPGKVQVLEGLQAGDLVITAGQAKPMMHEGAPVQVLPGADGSPLGAPAGPPAGSKPRPE